MANQYVANQLIQAINIVADKKLANLKVDKTVQAVIVDASAAENGEYQASFTDVTTGTEITTKIFFTGSTKYEENDIVYVTIPQGDMELDKYILGKVSKEDATEKPWGNTDKYKQVTQIYSAGQGVWNSPDINAAYEGGARHLLVKYKVSSDTPQATIKLQKFNSGTSTYDDTGYAYTISLDDYVGNPFSIDSNEDQFKWIILPNITMKPTNLQFVISSLENISSLQLAMFANLSSWQQGFTLSLNFSNSPKFNATTQVTATLKNNDVDVSDAASFVWYLNNQPLSTTTKTLILDKTLYFQQNNTLRCVSTYTSALIDTGVALEDTETELRSFDVGNFPQLKLTEVYNGNNSWTVTAAYDGVVNPWGTATIIYRWLKNNTDINKDQSLLLYAPKNANENNPPALPSENIEKDDIQSTTPFQSGDWKNVAGTTFNGSQEYWVIYTSSTAQTIPNDSWKFVSFTTKNVLTTQNTITFIDTDYKPIVFSCEAVAALALGSNSQSAELTHSVAAPGSSPIKLDIVGEITSIITDSDGKPSWNTWTKQIQFSIFTGATSEWTSLPSGYTLTVGADYGTIGAPNYNSTTRYWESSFEINKSTFSNCDNVNITIILKYNNTTIAFDTFTIVKNKQGLPGSPAVIDSIVADPVTFSAEQVNIALSSIEINGSNQSAKPVYWTALVYDINDILLDTYYYINNTWYDFPDSDPVAHSTDKVSSVSWTQGKQEYYEEGESGPELIGIKPIAKIHFITYDNYDTIEAEFTDIVGERIISAVSNVYEGQINPKILLLKANGSHKLVANTVVNCAVRRNGIIITTKDLSITVQYSTNAGGNWTTISTFDNNVYTFSLIADTVLTNDKLLIRIMQNGQVLWQDDIEGMVNINTYTLDTVGLNKNWLWDEANINKNNINHNLIFNFSLGEVIQQNISIDKIWVQMVGSGDNWQEITSISPLLYQNFIFTQLSDSSISFSGSSYIQISVPRSYFNCWNGIIAKQFHFKIQLTVNSITEIYDNIYTNFNYFMQGMPGTNGSKYILQILGAVEEQDENQQETPGDFIPLNYLFAYKSTDPNDYPIPAMNMPYLKTRLIDVITNEVVAEGKNISTYYDATQYFTITHPAQQNYCNITFNNLPNDDVWLSFVLKAQIEYNGVIYTNYLPILYGYSNWVIDQFNSWYAPYVFLNVVFDSTNQHGNHIIPLEARDDAGYSTFECNSNTKYLQITNNLLSLKSDIIYNGDFSNEIIKIVIEFDESTTLYIPVVMSTVTSLYNFLGDWDGQRIDVGEDYINSPVAAFGEKDNQNEFTGMVLGAVSSKSGSSGINNGLFGYYKNQRTFELNAENGVAKFGKTGAGQIVIDPAVDRGVIRSGNYQSVYLMARWDAETHDYKIIVHIEPAFSTDTNIKLHDSNDEIILSIPAGATTYTNSTLSTQQPFNISIIELPNNNNWIQQTSLIAPAAEDDNPFCIDYKTNKISGGMCIDLTTPSIQWGNGNFSIGADGKLNAVDGNFTGVINATGGTIGGFTINTNTLYYQDDQNNDFIIDTTNRALQLGNIILSNSKQNLSLQCIFYGAAAWNGENNDSYVQCNQYYNSFTSTSLLLTIYSTQLLYGSSDDSGTVNLNSQTIFKIANFDLTYKTNGTTITTPWLYSECKLYYNNQKTQNHPYYEYVIYGKGSYHSQSDYIQINASTQISRCDLIVQTDTFFFQHELQTQWEYDGQGEGSCPFYEKDQFVQDADQNCLMLTLPQSVPSGVTTLGTALTPFADTSFFKNLNANGFYAKQHGIMAYDSTGQIGYKFLIHSSLTDIANPGLCTFLEIQNNASSSSGSLVPVFFVRPTGELHCTSGTLDSGAQITSDRNKKNSIQSLPSQYLDLFDKLRPVVYKYNDGTSNRFHTGFIAQDLEEACEDLGISLQDFAAVTIENRGEEDETHYIRYEELIALNTAKIQQLDAENKQLKQELAELKESFSILRSKLDNLLK